MPHQRHHRAEADEHAARQPIERLRDAPALQLRADARAETRVHADTSSPRSRRTSTTSTPNCGSVGRAGVDELRQQRGGEQNRLRIAARDQKAVAKQREARAATALAAASSRHRLGGGFVTGARQPSRRARPDTPRRSGAACRTWRGHASRNTPSPAADTDSISTSADRQPAMVALERRKPWRAPCVMTSSMFGPGIAETTKTVATNSHQVCRLIAESRRIMRSGPALCRLPAPVRPLSATFS